MIAGYARVSTDGQSLEAQHSALQAAGAQRLYAEKISGAVTDRAALKRCLASLTPGDVVLVLGGLAEYERHLILRGPMRDGSEQRPVAWPLVLSSSSLRTSGRRR